MPNIKDIEVLKFPVKLLFVGVNGSGKSIAAASFHKHGKIQIEDSDIRMKPVAAYFPGADIEYNSWTSDNFIGFVNKIHDIIDGRFKPTFKTWVIDSMTGFSITSVVYQLKVKDKVKTTKGGMPATSWDEINGETVFFHEMLEAAQILFEKFGVNIIWTAHPVAKMEGSEGESSKRVISLAAYGNKIPNIVPGFFDEIYNVTRNKVGLEDKYDTVVHTCPFDNLPGKTALFDYVPNSFDIARPKNFYDVWSSFLKPKA